MDAYYSHYPFLEGAKEIVRKSSSVSQTNVSSEILEKAQERLEAAVLGGEVKALGMETQRSVELDLLSYAAARMVLVASKNKSLVARVAAAEAKRAARYLQAEGDEKLCAIGSELGMNIAMAGKEFETPFFDYLRFKPKEEEFKLSAKPIAGGTIKMSRKEAMRFVQEAARMKMEKVPLAGDTKFSPDVMAVAKHVIGMMPISSMPIQNISVADFPACINKIIEEMRNGEHIGHQARWALGVYLVKSGMKTEDLLEIYKSSPEYNESTTKYQLDYIRQKDYSVPSCATMDSYGLSQHNCPCLVGGIRRGTPATNSRRKPAVIVKQEKK